MFDDSDDSFVSANDFEDQFDNANDSDDSFVSANEFEDQIENANDLLDHRELITGSLRVLFDSRPNDDSYLNITLAENWKDQFHAFRRPLKCTNPERRMIEVDETERRLVKLLESRNLKRLEITVEPTLDDIVHHEIEWFLQDQIVSNLQSTVLSELVYRQYEPSLFKIIKHLNIKTDNLRLVVSDFCKAGSPIFDMLPDGLLMSANKIEFEGPLKGFLERMGSITESSFFKATELNFNVTNTDLLIYKYREPGHIEPIVTKYLEKIWNIIHAPPESLAVFRFTIPEVRPLDIVTNVHKFVQSKLDSHYSAEPTPTLRGIYVKFPKYWGRWSDLSENIIPRMLSFLQLLSPMAHYMGMWKDAWMDVAMAITLVPTQLDYPALANDIDNNEFMFNDAYLANDILKIRRDVLFWKQVLEIVKGKMYVNKNHSLKLVGINSERFNHDLYLDPRTVKAEWLHTYFNIFLNILADIGEELLLYKTIWENLNISFTPKLFGVNFHDALLNVNKQDSDYACKFNDCFTIANTKEDEPGPTTKYTLGFIRRPAEKIDFCRLFIEDQVSYFTQHIPPIVENKPTHMQFAYRLHR